MHYRLAMRSSIGIGKYRPSLVASVSAENGPIPAYLYNVKRYIGKSHEINVRHYFQVFLCS